MIEAQSWNDLSPDELDELEESEDVILLVRREDGIWYVVTPFSSEETSNVIHGLSAFIGRRVH